GGPYGRNRSGHRTRTLPRCALRIRAFRHPVGRRSGRCARRGRGRMGARGPQHAARDQPREPVAEFPHHRPERSSRMNRRPIRLHALVLLAVLAVVFGFLYWALVQVWGWLQVLMGPLGDLSQNALIGGWMVVAPLAIYIVRKPGVGILVEIIASIVEVVFLASPVGPTLILVAFIQGLGAEAAFAVTRYRRYGWGVFIASGVTA